MKYRKYFLALMVLFISCRAMALNFGDQMGGGGGSGTDATKLPLTGGTLSGTLSLISASAPYILISTGTDTNYASLFGVAATDNWGGLTGSIKGDALFRFPYGSSARFGTAGGGANLIVDKDNVTMCANGSGTVGINSLPSASYMLNVNGNFYADSSTMTSQAAGTSPLQLNAYNSSGEHALRVYCPYGASTLAIRNFGTTGIGIDSLDAGGGFHITAPAYHSIEINKVAKLQVVSNLVWVDTNLTTTGKLIGVDGQFSGYGTFANYGTFGGSVTASGFYSTGAVSVLGTGSNTAQYFNVNGSTWTLYASSMTDANGYVVTHSTLTFGPVNIDSGTWNSLLYRVGGTNGKAITLTKVYAETLTASTSVQFTLDYRTNGSGSSAGTSVLANSTACVTGVSITSFAQPIIPVNSGLYMLTPASGNSTFPASMNITIWYKENS